MKILMVCLGNICRSPMAEAILEQKLKKKRLSWLVDSAGTSGWHDGETPDARAISTCAKKGLNISNQRSRKIKSQDLDYFDLILAMDSSNYQDILKLCQNDMQRSKVKLILNYKYPNRNMAVPDPYYDDKFDEVYDLLDEAIDNVISDLMESLQT